MFYNTTKPQKRAAPAPAAEQLSYKKQRELLDAALLVTPLLASSEPPGPGAWLQPIEPQNSAHSGAPKQSLAVTHPARMAAFATKEANGVDNKNSEPPKAPSRSGQTQTPSCQRAQALPQAILPAGPFATAMHEARNELAAKHFDGAIEHFTSALALRPNALDALCGRADAYCRSERLPLAAVSDLSKLIELCPQNPFFLAQRGRQYRLLQRFSLSVADFDRAIALRPNEKAWLLYRGLLHQQAGQIQKALADFDSVIEINPADQSAIVLRGDLHCTVNHTVLALADFSAVLALNPRNYHARVRRGEIYRMQGSFSLALIDLSAAIDAQADTPTAYLCRADLYYALRQWDLALAELDRAITLQPGTARAWAMRGRVKINLGHPLIAKKDVEKALELTPDCDLALQLLNDRHTWEPEAAKKAHKRAGRGAYGRRTSSGQPSPLAREVPLFGPDLLAHGSKQPWHKTKQAAGEQAKCGQ